MRRLWIVLAAGWLMVTGVGGAWALTEEEVDARVQEAIEAWARSPEFDKRVEEGILKFIDKQRKEADARKNGAAERVAAVNPEKDHVRGKVDAPFSLIEYSDFECPYCKRFHGTARTFIERNPEVNWVYRNFPLDFHNPWAQREAEAAECVAALAGNDVYWSYIDAIFENTQSNGKGLRPGVSLRQLATERGVDGSQFDDCVKSGRFRPRIASELENGNAAGVTGTPGNFLRHNATGQVIAVPGAQPLDQLERALDALKSRVQ